MTKRWEMLMVLSRAHFRATLVILVLALIATISSYLAFRPDDRDTSIRVFTDKSNCLVQSGISETNIADRPTEAVAGLLVNASISALKKYFDDAASSTSSKILTAIGDLHFFEIEADEDNKTYIRNNLSCVAIVTGSFGRFELQNVPESLKSTKYLTENDPDSLFVKRENGNINYKNLIKLGLNDLPNTYVEFSVEREEYSSSYRLKPVIAYIRQFNSRFGHADEKSLEITVTIVRPALTGSLQAPDPTNAAIVAEIPVEIRGLKQGRLARKDAVVSQDATTVWMQEPLEFRDVTLQSVKSTLEPKETAYVAPVNVYLTYREVDQPQLFFYILRNIMGQDSEEISSKINSVVKHELR